MQKKTAKPGPVAVAHAVVDGEIRDAIRQLAKANHRSVAGQIRLALEQHLAREQASSHTTTSEGD